MTQPGKQEQLWRGEFGDAYVDRNTLGEAHLAALTANWARVMRCMMGAPPTTIFEGGANIGLNLIALRRLTDARFHALEPNAKARDDLAETGVIDKADILDGLLTKIDLPDGAVEMSFTSAVLIHVPPDDLLASCRELVRVSSRYVVALEYFAATPETILYREQTETLFKRDFGAFYLENFPQLRVRDYGFAWRTLTGLDNLTWWVFEKEPA